MLYSPSVLGGSDQLETNLYTWEERFSTEELSPSHWPVDLSVGLFGGGELLVDVRGSSP